MSQEQGLGGEIRDPGPAPAPWSAPDPTDRSQSVSTAGVTPPPVQTAEPIYRRQQDGIPLRPLGIGELLDGTFSTIRRNPRATIGLAALLVTLQELLSIGLQLASNGVPTLTDPEDDISLDMLFGGFGGLSGTLVAAVVGAVLTGMLVVVVSEDVLGRRVTAADVWRRIRPRMWALIVAAAVSGILPYVGLLFLFVPGLILWALWALTTPALVLEGLGPFAALRRSARLASPALVRVWWTRALSVLIGLLIELVVALPFELAGLALVTVVREGEPGQAVVAAALALTALGEIVAGMITAPFLAGVLALLYLDRRMRAEGLDFVLRRHERVYGGQSVGRPAVGGAP